MNESMMDADRAAVTTSRRRRRDDQNELDKRATRALRSEHLGECLRQDRLWRVRVWHQAHYERWQPL